MRRALMLLVLFVACGRTVVYDPPPPYVQPPTMTVPDAGPMDAGVVKPCMTGEVALNHATPALFFVLDKSGSMAFDVKGNEGPPFGPPLEGPRRWEILEDVLGDVLPMHDRDLSMGVLMFPNDNECGVGAVEDITPRLGNSSRILQLFQTREPGGGTPIADAMDAVSVPARFAKANSLILVTDGEPNCNSFLDPLTCTCTQATTGFPPICPMADICLDDTRSVRAVEDLRLDAGIVTHVVGFATAARAAPTLDAMAVAGGAPRQGMHKFNSAETQAELADVLSGISEKETNCTWTATTALKSEDMLEVRLDGTVIPEGSGWTWLNRERGEFQLRGDWCDRSLTGVVTARLTCR